MPGFVSVAAVYNVILGHVLAQGVDRRDASTVAWAVTVLAWNEAWNVLLFGRRSTGAAFAGVLGFLVPLAGLQVSVWPDRRSRWSLLPSVGAWLSAAPQRSGHSIGRRRG